MIESSATKILEPLFAGVHKRYNLNLADYAIASLQRRLDRFRTLHYFDTIQSLTDKLVNDSQFFDLFVREITVNTTEMFRDPQCWNILRTEVFPVLDQMPTIRIWHAGCSSGEEVYSMAILLKELGLYEKSKLVATDLNKEVILHAAAGVYPLKSVAQNEENYLKAGGISSLSNYYEVQDTDIAMDPALLTHVKFLKHDLSTGLAFSKFDLILCRNVMIYFNKGLQEKVFDLFHKSLFKNGFVAIGKKETMTYFTGYNLFSEFNQIEKVYRLK